MDFEIPEDVTVLKGEDLAATLTAARQIAGDGRLVVAFQRGLRVVSTRCRDFVPQSRRLLNPREPTVNARSSR